MRQSIYLLSLVLLSFIAVSVHAKTSSDPTGFWLTENERAVIKIEQCREQLCGNIYWIIEDGQQVDKYNPDPELRNRPLCGLQILSGFVQDEDTPEAWEDGKIYKADDGDLYRADIKVIDQERLKVRGYIGIPLFGKTQIWKRVDPENYPYCGA